VRLPRQNESDRQIENVVQPDISVICDPGKLDERGCRGAPDWVIEVLSANTAAHDQIRKCDLYECYG
jgi:Uma2 family endonuclease